jgi:hypothetical protein
VTTNGDDAYWDRVTIVQDWGDSYNYARPQRERFYADYGPQVKREETQHAGHEHRSERPKS